MPGRLLGFYLWRTKVFLRHALRFVKMTASDLPEFLRTRWVITKRSLYREDD